MTDKPDIPPVDTDPAALKELAKRETDEKVVDQQAAGTAAASGADDTSEDQP